MGLEPTCQLKIGHRIRIVYVHEDDWRPEQENQFAQEAERVVTWVLVSVIRVSFMKKGLDSLQLTIAN